MLLVQRKNTLRKVMSSDVIRQLVKYFIIGGLAAVTNLSMFYVLAYILNLYYLVSAAIGFVSGAVLNYTLNRKYTFKNTYRNKTKQFTVFLIVASTSLIWNELLIYFFVEYIALSKMIAAVLSVGIVFLWSFAMHKIITFGMMK